MKKKAKFKHNKKQNVAFLFEILTKEIAKCAIQKNKDKQKLLTSLLKESFAKNTLIKKEFLLFKELLEASDLDYDSAFKLIEYCKKEHSKLCKASLKNEKLTLSENIKNICDNDVFSAFVPNFKHIASINQIFSDDTSIKSKVLLEKTILETLMSEEKKEEQNLEPIDNLIVDSMIKRFNEKYSASLLENQRHLIKTFILKDFGFHADFVSFINEQIASLKASLQYILERKQELIEDDSMKQQFLVIVEKLNSYKQLQSLDDEKILTEILKIQHLVNEASADDN